MKFTTLLHHITASLLVESFYDLKRNAAAGVDGVTWREYEGTLYTRVHELHREIHTGAYRAQASRRSYIQKADGKMRPLGIAALEDKVVQQAVVKVLSAIFDEVKASTMRWMHSTSELRAETCTGYWTLTYKRSLTPSTTSR